MNMYNKHIKTRKNQQKTSQNQNSLVFSIFSEKTWFFGFFQKKTEKTSNPGYVCVCSRAIIVVFGHHIVIYSFLFVYLFIFFFACEFFKSLFIYCVCLSLCFEFFFFGYWICDLAIHGAQFLGFWRWYRQSFYL